MATDRGEPVDVRADVAPEALEQALAAWRAVLGAEHVIVEEAALARVARATFPTAARVPAIVRPADTAQVQEVLRVANRFGVAVYPVSGGRNWGYGSRAPTASGQVLLDLARLDAITDFDPAMARVTVGPGVTFARLAAFLRARGGDLLSSCGGGPPEGSVLANALERGDGGGPYGDRFAHVSDLEVVLPSGELLHTGFSRFSTSTLAARAAGASRWGVGPVLDGLFSQSNLGVVTRMTVPLWPRPAVFQSLFVRLPDDDRLPELVDALRRLRLDGTLTAPCALWNDAKALALLPGRPHRIAQGREAQGALLTPERRGALAAEAGFGRWSCMLPLSAASRARAEADREHALAVLGQLGIVRVGDESGGPGRASPATAAVEVHEFDPRADDELLGPALGAPHVHSLRSMYFAREQPMPEDPARIDPDGDGCGFLWCSPAVPLEGEAVLEAVAILEETMLEHGFEPMVALIVVGDRAVNAAASLVWDREQPGADARALACHAVMIELLAEAGFHPFRLPVGAEALLADREDTTARVLESIKGALDPSGALAPGRYGIGQPTDRTRR